MAVRRSLGIIVIVLAWYFGMPINYIIILGLLALFVIFVVVPAIFHYNATLQRHMVFLPWVKWPKNIDFNKPQNEGLKGTLNYYLETDPSVQVGVWHLLPESQILESERFDEISDPEEVRKFYDDSLRNGKTIMLYLHGNTGSRGRDHRIELYKVLRSLDYHVIAFDYRGYADSSPAILTKTGVVSDALAVYRHVIKLADGRSPVFVYGHSLGTAVSSQLVSNLCLEGHDPPKGLILESPFNNIYDEIKKHPMSYPWRKMPAFDWIFTGNLAKNDVGFASDAVISNIHIPIIIFHAEDDLVVPYELGQKLYETALEKRPKNFKPIQFVPFSYVHGYGHKYIYAAPEMPEMIEDFVNRTLNDNWNNLRVYDKSLK